MKQESNQSETEEIPEEWKVKELGEVCQLVKKQYSPSKRDIRAYIGLENIEQQNLKLINIGSSENIESNKFEFKAGQILFGKLRPYFRKVYRPKFDGVCSTDIWVIESKGQFDNGFLFYFLADQRIIDEASNSSEGTRMPRARWDYLSRLSFEFPSIVEQRAIASILGSLDDKIALNRQMNSTLEAIGQELFKRWFVDFEFPNEEGNQYRSSGGEMVETELGDVPTGWRVGTFADLAEKNKGDIVDGPFGSNLKSSDYTDFGVRLIHQENIKEFNFIDEKQRYTSFEKAAELKRSVAFPGDIVMTKMPEPITRAARVPHNISKEFIIMADCIRVRPGPDTPGGYLLYLINSKSFRQQAEGLATGTTRSRINLTQVKSIKIVIPSKTCRKAFGIFSESLESLREKNSYEISIISAIRDALLPKLMSGEIKVK